MFRQISLAKRFFSLSVLLFSQTRECHQARREETTRHVRSTVELRARKSQSAALASYSSKQGIGSDNRKARSSRQHMRTSFSTKCSACERTREEIRELVRGNFATHVPCCVRFLCLTKSQKQICFLVFFKLNCDAIFSLGLFKLLTNAQ